MATVPIHRLRRNERERSPAQVLVLDTETTHTEDARGTEDHTLRLWCCSYVRRGEVRRKGEGSEDAWGRTGAELAAFLDRKVAPGAAAVLFDLNVAFDLPVSRLLQELEILGWAVTDVSLHHDAPWVRLRRGRRRLVVVEAFSWLHASIEYVGALVGIPKVDLPLDDAPEAAWLDRCRSDVAILRRAMLDVLDWWDRAGLGSWSITGSACGWSAYRHRFMYHQPVIDPDPDRRALERSAIYGGRREAYRVFEERRGSFEDWDFRNAYPTVAAQVDLPVKGRRPFDSLPVEVYRRWRGRRGVVAKVVVEDADGLVPERVGDRVYYPEGRVETVLASPEIDLLLDEGKTVTIGPGWCYDMAAFLQPWARWILDVVTGATDAPPVVRELVAKHWSRSVIGRFASRSSRREEVPPRDVPDWTWEPYQGMRGAASGAWLTVGGRSWMISRDVEGENAAPAVLAFVESHCRARLTRALRRLPRGSVLQCDTDGWLLDAAAAGLVDELEGIRDVIRGRGRLRGPAPWAEVLEALTGMGLKIKDRLRDVEVLGPQQVRIDGVTRFAGIPSSARELPGLAFVTKPWPGITWQMAHAPPGTFRRPCGVVTVGRERGNRWIGADGWTWPVQVRGSNGARAVAPFAVTSAAGLGVQLADRQSAHLARINSPP